MLVAALLLTFRSTTAPPLPFLSPVFGDHMVLQRDKTNTLWGWSTPGTKVRVTIAGRHGDGLAGPDGKWQAKITPPPVGGPYLVEVDGAQHLEVKDVMVGDVWICSGQSNMEMGIGAAQNGAAEIANSDHPGIRLYMVPRAIAATPQSQAAGTWRVCGPSTIAVEGWGGFSAAAYYFGRELNQKLNIPIGLVETCWGGTVAEAWTSREALYGLPDFQPALKQLDSIRSQAPVPYEIQVDAWMVRYDPGSLASNFWGAPAYDDHDWMSIDSPATYERVGLADFDGIAWFRKTITLDMDQASKPAKLHLGAIDDADATWVNGKRVGSTFVYNANRDYDIPAGTLHEGVNTIAVRVLDTGVTGGMTSPTGSQNLEIDGKQIPLAGPWKYRASTDFKKTGPLPFQLSDNPNVSTVLYNGMIAPLLPMAIKGAIWYQGESNADRAYQYRNLMPTLIEDWRLRFAQPDFPFLIVQLANFTARAAQPEDAPWAELREAQAMTATKLPKVGLAVAIDIGMANDIHPVNKQEVGHRLALNALKIAYGQDVAYSGPVYKKMRVEVNTIRLTFDHIDGGLKAVDGKLGGFAIAGEDRKFVWADAHIEGDNVIVSAKGVAKPVAVRYAWASNPEAGLANGAGLPAVPFRTDDWPGVTAKTK